MAQQTILLVDNDRHYLDTMAEVLKRAGYEVLTAENADDARRIEEQREIDLAILDVRLEREDDEKDTSGLRLADELDALLPKIILTRHGATADVAEALTPRKDGLPSAIRFVEKRAPLEVLLQAVRDALQRGGPWLEAVNNAIHGRDGQLEKDYLQARKQQQVLFWSSLVVSAAGVLIVFAGIVSGFIGNLRIGLVSSASGIVMGAVSALFLARVDVFSKLMSRNHQERNYLHWFGILLRACESLDVPERHRCREQLIRDAAQRFLGLADPDRGKGREE